MEKINGYSIFVLISAGMKFRNKKKFRHVIPAYTGPFGALNICNITNSKASIILMKLNTKEFLAA
jgi:hypothetical protein